MPSRIKKTGYTGNRTLSWASLVVKIIPTVCAKTTAVKKKAINGIRLFWIVFKIKANVAAKVIR